MPAVNALSAGQAFFAEKPQLRLDETVSGFTEARHGLGSPLPFGPFRGPRLERRLFGLENRMKHPSLGGVHDEECVRGIAVASGAPRLLEIGLHRGRHADVDDEADVGLVDSHPEGVGRHHDHALPVQEGRGASLPLVHVHLTVVAVGGQSPPAQEGRHLFALSAGLAVDHPAVAPVSGREERKERLLLVRPVLNVVAKVRTVKRRSNDGTAQMEHPHHVLLRFAARRGGKRDERHVGTPAAKLAEFSVVGAELMPPEGHAVRLVHGDEGRARRQSRAKHALGREVEKIEFVRVDLPADLPDLVR